MDTYLIFEEVGGVMTEPTTIHIKEYPGALFPYRVFYGKDSPAIGCATIEQAEWIADLIKANQP